MTTTITTSQQLWRTAFDSQMNDKLMERLFKETLAYTRRLERRTPWRESLSPDDRLHAAIVKLLDGTRTWEPERVDLAKYLRGSIMSDLFHEVAHAKQFPHVSLDDDAQNFDDLESETSEALAASRVAKNEAPVENYWSRMLDQMRALAAGDLGVHAIIDAYAHGALAPRDVMHHTGMSEREFRAAYRRLLRVAKKLDEDLIDTIMQAIA